MEGYKPQDFSFFHRSEKLVQQDNIIATQGLTNLFAGQLDIDSTDKLCSNAFDGESNKSQSCS